MTRVQALTALGAVAALLLGGCSGADEPVTPTLSASPADVPSRAELDAVAAAVNLRASDLPRSFTGSATAAGTLELGRATDAFAACLGLDEPLSRSAVASMAFRSSEERPLVDWSSEVTRHSRAQLRAAVRAFGTSKGPSCLRPLVTDVLLTSADYQNGVSVEDVRVVGFPVDRGALEAAAGVRATAELRGPGQSVGFAVDLVLLADRGFGVTLYGYGFDQVPPEGQRRALTEALVSRLGRAAR